MAKFTLWALLSLTTLVTCVNTIAIRGPLGGADYRTGARPARLEFSIFKDSGPAFDLFIQSFRQFMQQNQSSLISYYRVCGIHGHPYTSWDGVEGGGYDRGYCPHGSILFPSWHRPYLALFEELIWTNAQYIAMRYPFSERWRYREAARTLRIPYWDWTINPAMPDLTNTPWITINAPGGPSNVSNPLFEYAFHPQPPGTDFPPGDYLATLPHTVRYPDAAGNSQPELANKQLVANGQALQILTYQLIAEQSDYAPFSNTGYTDGRGGRYNSIENMHNAIHSLVGNGGHMSIIPYSAFDPIFWLHHANVDRLIALWQAIYPDSWATSQVNEIGTFTDAPGSFEDANSPLTPFHSDHAGTLYTSETARYTHTFGYTYPEIEDWNLTASQLSSNVRRELNKLYNPTGAIPTPGSRLHKRDGKKEKAAAQHPNAADHQYFVNIRVETSSLHSSFFIHFFLGPIPAAPETWSFAPTLIASQSVLAPSSTRTYPLVVYGQIPLTHALLADVDLLSLDPDNVIPLLKNQLRWRIQKFDDSVIENEEVESLRLYVVGQRVTQGGPDQFPTYGPLLSYREVTKGKAGGLGQGDPL